MANEIVVAIISLIGLLVVSITGNIILMTKRNSRPAPSNIVTHEMILHLEAKLDRIVQKLDEHLQYHLEMANRDRYPHESSRM